MKQRLSGRWATAFLLLTVRLKAKKPNPSGIELFCERVLSIRALRAGLEPVQAKAWADRAGPEL